MPERKNLINKFLIPVDKANHFIVGTILYTLVSLIFSPALAIISVIFVGVAKEIYDERLKAGNADIMDIIFTVLGAIPPMLLDTIK